MSTSLGTVGAGLIPDEPGETVDEQGQETLDTIDENTTNTIESGVSDGTLASDAENLWNHATPNPDELENAWNSTTPDVSTLRNLGPEWLDEGTLIVLAVVALVLLRPYASAGATAADAVSN